MPFSPTFTLVFTQILTPYPTFSEKIGSTICGTSFPLDLRFGVGRGGMFEVSTVKRERNLDRRQQVQRLESASWEGA